MSNAKEDLERLAEEQTEHQFPPNPLNNIIRSRTLAEYSSEFGMPSEWLATYLTELVLTQDKVVFADLGCGDMVALVEALKLADKLGKDNLRAIGIDVLPPDPNAIFASYRKYTPEFTRADIDNSRFPEMADLVTLCNVLLWTRDPLSALANAAAQTKVGGVICANNLNGIYETVGEQTYQSLFRKRIYMQNGEFAGFQLLNNLSSFPEAVVLRKVDPLNTPEEIAQAWLGSIPKLHLRTSAGVRGGFDYYYIFP